MDNASKLRLLQRVVGLIGPCHYQEEWEPNNILWTYLKYALDDLEGLGEIPTKTVVDPTEVNRHALISRARRLFSDLPPIPATTTYTAGWWYLEHAANQIEAGAAERKTGSELLEDTGVVRKKGAEARFKQDVVKAKIMKAAPTESEPVIQIRWTPIGVAHEASYDGDIISIRRRSLACAELVLALNRQSLAQLQEIVDAHDKFEAELNEPPPSLEKKELDEKAWEMFLNITGGRVTDSRGEMNTAYMLTEAFLRKRDS
jgi:hypothetical protein